jgi:putative ABC transport system permease protein
MVYKMDKVEVNQQMVIRTRGASFSMDEAVSTVDRNSLDQITVKVKNSDLLKEAAHLVERILQRKHYGVKDYDVILPEQLLEQKQKTQRIFNIVMGAIAGISLLVGGIGIMNIMLANIMERTREIGVRRAVGATKIDVLTQFLFEAITLSIIGGLLGILVGFILTAVISTYAEWKTFVSPIAVILAFFVSAITGIIFGIYPAKKAADKNPIESLRYE